jgi:lipopolysaccharide export LptBFGC system permease protein LptF
MNPRARASLQIGFLILLVLGLMFLFPRALGFVEMAARELRYFWWLILLVALAIWLIWAGRRRL